MKSVEDNIEKKLQEEAKIAPLLIRMENKPKTVAIVSSLLETLRAYAQYDPHKEVQLSCAMAVRAIELQKGREENEK